MKALITGADGQLGWELQRTKPHECEIIACTHTLLDITDETAVRTALHKHQPDFVINAAAYTAVDKAESEKEWAYQVNGAGAANIAKAAEESNARLIHISTDFVFDGAKCSPYLPQDRPNPINEYGAGKLQGEEAVLIETRDKALILRTGWVYSGHGKNFVKTMLRLMVERDEISVVEDQIGSPTWARDLAKAVWHFTGNPELHGIFHWTDAGIASWYDFAVAIQEEAHHLGILPDMIPIKPIQTKEFPTPAKRPHYSVLDKTATWDALGYYALHWRKALRMMLTELRTED
jgi:dTDP-4-dehydrorhamnose reductase